MRHIEGRLYRLFLAIGLAIAEPGVIARIGNDADDLEPAFVVFAEDEILLIELQHRGSSHDCPMGSPLPRYLRTNAWFTSATCAPRIISDWVKSRP